MKSKRILVFILVSLLLITILKDLYYPLRSYIIMYPYSHLQKAKSLLKDGDMTIKIPGGTATKEKDWYPFILCHNDEGFKNWAKKDVSLTILYNFGQFNFYTGESSFFDPNSPYYSSFYGGYIVRDNGNGKFPFKEDGTLDIEGASKIPEYDYKYLVLNSFNCPSGKRIFDTNIIAIDIVNYLGLDNWYRIDSLIKTAGVAHKKKDNLRSYIQYGIPGKGYEGEDFPITDLWGRVYIKHFEEADLTIILYIITPSLENLNATDKNILSKTRLYINKQG